MSTLQLDKLSRLIGESRARAHMAGECYIANVRCFMDSREDTYRRDCVAALDRWIELMRAAVAEYDATKAKPAVADGSTAPSGPSLP